MDAARSLVGDCTSISSDALFKIAFALKDKDNDKDAALALLRKDKDMEIERKLSEIEKKQLRAFLEKQLSNLAQRCVLENLFSDVYRAYKDDGTPVFKAINGSAEHSKVILAESKKEYPAKTPINKVMQDPAIKAAVWEHFKFDVAVAYPTFKDELLYGRLSRLAHSPDFRRVLVSDTENENYKSFMALLASHYEFEFSVYSELDAANGEEAYDK